MNTITIMAFATVGIVLIVAVISIFCYQRTLKTSTLSKTSQDEWLFSNFHDSVFDICYKSDKKEKLCGIDVREYERYCSILHEQPNIKKLVALRVEGFFLGVVCLTLGYLSMNNLSLTIGFLITGIAALYLMSIAPFKLIKHRAEERLFKIKDDLSRFLALLEKAMDLPIDQAILVTAAKFESPLADDLMNCIHQVSLGAGGWQKTMMDLAKVYEIEVFSDLVLEIVNSFEQGVQIRPLVNRKAYEIEQIRLYDVEAHDSKIKSMIFFPIIAFKVLPLMALIGLPMLGDFMH